MKKTLLAAALAAAAATGAAAAPEKYVLDAGHSQILFDYNHLGYSTTYGLFSGFEGEIMFDQEDPAASSVSVSMPLSSMFTGWQARFDHFMTKDFFDATEDETISFTSTGIEVTGDNTAASPSWNFHWLRISLSVTSAGWKMARAARAGIWLSVCPRPWIYRCASATYC